MKYEVIKEFTDKNNYDIKYKKGMVIELTKDRAEEILSVDKLIKKVVKPKKEK